MNEFNQMFQQAVAIKSHEMHSKRKVFEKQSLFIKAGLYYLNEFKDQRKLPFEERLAIANELKEKGNQFFKEGKYSNASHEYEKSLSIFLFIENKNPNWKNEGIIDDDLTYVDEGEDEKVKDVRVKSLLNLAMCYIKEKQWKDAIAACDYVLNIQENAKAYYRRAKARIDNINSDENDYKLAIDDFEKALILEDDEAIRKELTKAKLEVRKMMRSNVEISQNVIKNIEKTAPKEVQTQQVEEETSSDEEENYEYSDDWKKYAFNTLNYEPSYEEDQNIPIPEEIVELGKFIETRGVQLLQIYETSQKIDEADKHRQFLSQLMAAKVKIERISKSNFSKPIKNEKAAQFGIDLSDPGVQEEFKTLLEQNLRDLRKWLREQNWKLRKQKIIKNVSKLAEKEKLGKLDQETGKNSAYDWIVMGICAVIILLSCYYYIFDN